MVVVYEYSKRFVQPAVKCRQMKSNQIKCDFNNGRIAGCVECKRTLTIIFSPPTQYMEPEALCFLVVRSYVPTGGDRGNEILPEIIIYAPRRHYVCGLSVCVCVRAVAFSTGLQ